METNFTSQMIKATETAIKEKELELLLFANTKGFKQIIIQSELIDLHVRIGHLKEYGTCHKPAVTLNVNPISMTDADIELFRSGKDYEFKAQQIDKIKRGIF